MKKLLFTLVLLLSSVVGNAQTFKLGDVNKDGKVTIADVMMVVHIVLNGYMPLELSSDYVEVDCGSSATVNIFSGYGPYEITCSDENLVGVSLNGTFLSITGKAVGTAVVTVTDTSTDYTKDINVTVNAEPLTISNNTVEVTAGESATVEITSGSGNYSVVSSDPSVATATVSNGIVTIISVAGGTATITVTDTQSGQTATIEVTVDDNHPQSYLLCPDDHHPHMIDLGLPSGTKWACCNVGADKPEAYGGYYAWGETETKSTYNWSTYIHSDGSYDTCKDLGSDIAGTEYDVAHVKWGGSWLMPSHDQQEELRNNCTSTWTTQNGVSGRLFTGTNGGSIFLPAAGHRENAGLNDVGLEGNYWPSTQYPSSTYLAYSLLFYSGFASTYYYDRYNGFTVRPVSRN